MNIFKQLGLSLLELIVTISLISVILAFGIPSYQTFLTQSKDRLLSAQLMQAIQFARDEAIARGTSITLCKSSNQKSCGGEWLDGFVVTDHENVIYAFRNVTDKGRIYWRASLNRSELEFLPTGFTRAENGSFWYCPTQNAKPEWAIMLSKTGRAHLVLQGDISDGSLVCPA